MGQLPVDHVDIHHLVAALQPIWTSKTETAGRVRQRIEVILDWARVMGYRSADNPARWQGNLSEILPKPSKVKRVQHHRALPYAQVPGFIAKLRQRTGIVALALEFQILTASRTGEVIGATWSEIDLASTTWSVPADRIKAGRTHRVPLSRRAQSILEGLETREGLLFPGPKPGKPLSTNAMLALVDRMELRGSVVPHGFRSSFRDWAAEMAIYPREVAEAALAHAMGNATRPPIFGPACSSGDAR